MNTVFTKVCSVVLFSLVMLLAIPVSAVDLSIGVNILGVWSCNQNLYGDPAHPTVVTDKDYFIETFHPDLTDLFQNTALNSQKLSIAPQGLYGSALQGKWLVTGSNTVSRIASFLVNAKITNVPDVTDFIAGTPVARALVKCNCSMTGPDTMKVVGKVQFYPVDNIDFSSTIRVLPDLPFDATCSRLKYTSGN